MLAPRIILPSSHTEDLAVVCSIGAGTLFGIAQRIEEAGPTIRRAPIEQIMLDEAGPQKGSILSYVVFGIAASFRRRSMAANDILDRLEASIKSAAKDDQRFRDWGECRRALSQILQTTSVTVAAKALDISYDFERIYVAGRLLTSVRPVFNEERDKILGATIVQTLRLEYIAPNGDQSNISIAMDKSDIEELLEECSKALQKAELAKIRFADDYKFEAIIPGEEDA
jgi:hypothetical protein